MAHLPGICASKYLCLRGSLGAFQFRSFAFVSIVPELGGNFAQRWDYWKKESCYLRYARESYFSNPHTLIQYFANTRVSFLLILLN
jgi:hypothetical protein